MDRPSPYTVRVKDENVQVRLVLIASDVYEATGKSLGMDFIIRGSTVDDALARFKHYAEQYADEQARKVKPPSP